MIKFFIKEWSEELKFYASLSTKEKQESRRAKTRGFICFLISIVLHTLFLFLAIQRGFSSDSTKPIDIELALNNKGFELAEGMVSLEVKPIYDKKGDIIIAPSMLKQEKNKTPKDKKALALNQLLKNLKASKGPTLSDKVKIKQPKSKKTSQLEKEQLRLQKSLQISESNRPFVKTTKPKMANLWLASPLTKTKKQVKPANYTNIMKVIDQKSFQFRDCYEKALLKDELLSVKVVFLLQLRKTKVQKTRLELHGKGNPESRRTLTHCLFRESKTLVVLQNKNNISVKFNLIFGL